MYEYLKGTITAILPSYIVIDIQGVGYRVLVANPYTFSLNSTMTVYVEQIIRDNDQNLYGFLTKEDKDLFQKLLNVSGIGPKSALAILANGDAEGLISAVENDNVAYLTQFPGVGKKTAQQIVLDLKGKLDELASKTGMINASSNPEQSQALDDALEALLALGYTAKDVKAVAQIIGRNSDTTDGYIRSALKLLVK